MRELAWRICEALVAILVYQCCVTAAPATSTPLIFLPEAGGYSARAQGFTARFEKDGLRIGEQIAVRWPGGRGDVFPVAVSRVEVRAFLGRSPSGWRSAEGAGEIRYPELYPGIDLRYAGRGGELKSEFVVAPGADPAVIRIRYEGAISVRLSPAGGLRIEARDGVWTEEAPFMYQERDGGFSAVDGAFVLLGGGEVAYRIGGYDRSKPLVIDPALRYSGVFGGHGISAATAVAADPGGYVYLAGYTDAYDYPNVSPLLARGGGADGFLMKIETATGRVVSSTFIGGNGDDRIFGICRDPAGNVYLAGWTTSPDFPVRSAVQATLNGGRDAFVMKIDAAGSNVVFSTFFGGGGVETANSVACDAGGVWIGGDTDSTNLPVQQAWLSSRQGGQDGFIAHLSEAGALVSSTYAGGTGSDTVRALAIDSAGAVYAAGASSSPALGFPSSSFRQTPRGGQDGFVLKLAAAGNALLGGGFIGGSRGGADGEEGVNAIALRSDALFAAGQTASPDFPLLNAWRPAFQGASEAFLVKIDLPLENLLWSTFAGGAADEAVNTLALDAGGGLIAGGWTTSPDMKMLLPVQMGFSGGTEGFVIRTANGEGAPLFQSYLGGTGNDTVSAVAADAASRIVAAGQTSSLNYPVTGDTAVPPGSLSRAFMTEIAAGAAAEPLRLDPQAGSGFAAALTLTLTHPTGYAQIGGGSLLIHDSVSFLGGCRVRYSRSSGAMELASDGGNTWAVVTPGSSAQASNSSCTLKGAGSLVSQSGIFLNLTFALEFKDAFSGVHNIYASAWGQGGETAGYKLFGSWRVPGGAHHSPTPHSVTTNAPNENVQTLSILIKDPDGGADIDSALVLIQNSFTGSQACFLWLDRAGNRLYLADDTAANWVGVVFGSSGTVQNSQCLVRAAVATSETFGENWLVRAEVTFKAAFQGSRKVWVQARDADGNLSAWAELAQLSIAPPSKQPPSITSVLPASGHGSAQVFQVTANDPNGVTDLVSVLFLVHATPASSGGCMVLYDRAAGKFLLADDAGVNWSAVRPATTDVARNGQCILRGAGSSWTGSGFTGTAVIDLQFDPSFSGRKRLWARAVDSSNLSSALKDFGGFDVESGAQLANSLSLPPAPQSPSAPLLPVSGQGIRQVFQLSFPHDGMSRNSSRAVILFSNSNKSGRTCQIVADVLTGRFYVADEWSQFWRQIEPGSNSMAGSSYCSLHGLNSGWVFSGGYWRLSMDIEFHAPMIGKNYIWLQAVDGRSLAFGPAISGSFTVEAP